MVHHIYSVTTRGDGWGVEHMGKLLDVYPTRTKAQEAVDRLAKLTQASGHDAEVIVQDTSGEIQSDHIYRRIER